MEPNDNTDVQNDLAVTNDYSVTLKDDGKLLYRWGNMVKQPNDIRLRAMMDLPAEWKERDDDGNLPDIEVHSAFLVVDHLVTNNPNVSLCFHANSSYVPVFILVLTPHPFHFLFYKDQLR